MPDVNVKKLSELDAADAVEETHLIPVHQGGSLKRATAAQVHQATASKLTPVVFTKNNGDISVPTTSLFAWADLDTGGTAAARPWDIVVPGVSEGDWVEVFGEVYWKGVGSTTLVLATMFPIVAGAPVRPTNTHVFSTQQEGAQAAHSASGSYLINVQAGDIDGGNLRLRFRHSGTVGRDIQADANVNFRIGARGPFG